MENIKKIAFQLPNNKEEIIRGDFYYYRNSLQNLPLIIISHGFKGFKDWGFIPYVAKEFIFKGAFVVCFNFSLNGDPDEDLFIADLEKFANNTVSQQLSDLNELIAAFPKGKILNYIRKDKEILRNLLEEKWNKNIFLLGHSLGGALSLLAAKSNPAVNKATLWASVGKFDRYTERQKSLWKKNGAMEFTNLRTGQILKMNVSYLEDIEQNNKIFNLEKVISEIDKPVLLVHGSQDMTVPVKEVQKLIDAGRNGSLRAEIIEKTGHTFGIEHPFQNTNPALEKAINISQKFFAL